MFPGSWWAEEGPEPSGGSKGSEDAWAEDSTELSFGFSVTDMVTDLSSERSGTTAYKGRERKGQLLS